MLPSDRPARIPCVLSKESVFLVPFLLAFTTAITQCGGGGKSVSTPTPSNNPVPTVASLSPASLVAGSAPQTVSIKGAGFLTSSIVTFNKLSHPATYVSASQLTIQLSAADLATAGSYSLIVTNPSPGGGASAAFNFTVAAGNPVPTVSSLSPASLVAGSTPQTLIINGTGFLTNSTIAFNKLSHAATYVSALQLTIQLSAADLATAGSYSLIVTNPSPGGGASAAFNFTVAAGNALTINITGLSSGTRGKVAVAGPNSYSQTLTQTATLTSLAPGAYTITAAVVPSTLNGDTAFIPSISGSPVSVTPSSSSSIAVVYGSLSTTWQPVGPSAVNGALSGKLQAVAIENQNPLIMYAGAGADRGPINDAGIYKTTDGGNTWNPVDMGLSTPLVDDIWLDQNNPNILVAGVDVLIGPGIFRSTDAGAHWSPVAPFLAVSAFAQVGGTLYAGTGQGIAQSTDDGATWTLIQATARGVRSLSASGGAIYAGLDGGKVLVQSSSGASWVSSSPSGSSTDSYWTVAINPANSNNAFVAIGGVCPPNNLYVTNDAGTSWSNVTSAKFAVQRVAFDPVTSVLYAATDGETFQSSDNGITWTQVTGAVWDVRLIVPNVGGVQGNLLLGGDQGLFLRPNGVKAWQSLTANISSFIITGFDVNGSTILAAAQDFPPVLSFDGGASWQSLGAAGTGEPPTEDGTILFNSGNHNYAYVLGPNGFAYSTDGGHTFQSVSSIPGSAFTVTSGTGDLVAIDPGNSANVYVAATNGVYKSTDWGQHWQLQSWPVSNVTLVAVSPANSSTIFVGTGSVAQSGSLLVTRDGGATWATSNILGSTCGPPISIAFYPANPSVVFVGSSEVDQVNPAVGTCIQRSDDGGVNFSIAHTGIPNQAGGSFNGAVPHIKFDPSGSGIVAADTPSGLYISSDLGDNWTNIRGNAVSPVFTGVTWSEGYMYASTNGQGVLRMTFPF